MKLLARIGIFIVYFVVAFMVYSRAYWPRLKEIVDKDGSASPDDPKVRKMANVVGSLSFVTALILTVLTSV